MACIDLPTTPEGGLFDPSIHRRAVRSPAHAQDVGQAKAAADG